MRIYLGGSVTNCCWGTVSVLALCHHVLHTHLSLILTQPRGQP